MTRRLPFATPLALPRVTRARAAGAVKAKKPLLV